MLNKREPVIDPCGIPTESDLTVDLDVISFSLTYNFRLLK